VTTVPTLRSATGVMPRS